MKVKILDSRIKPEMLQPATMNSAGIDLRACLQAPVSLYPNQEVFIPSGIAVAIPEGFVGLLVPRSGLSTKQGIILSNIIGVIDADYRGEVKVAVWRKPVEQAVYTIEPMDKIAQLLVVPMWNNVIIVDELDETERGINGFGSTGK